MEAKQEAEKPHGLTEDQAMAAFAENLNYELSEDEQLKSKEAIAKKKLQDKANAELKNLQSNEATAAFAGLVEQMDVEQKAENFKETGKEEAVQEEASPAPAETKKAAPKKVVQKPIVKAQKSVM